MQSVERSFAARSAEGFGHYPDLNGRSLISPRFRNLGDVVHQAYVIAGGGNYDAETLKLQRPPEILQFFPQQKGTPRSAIAAIGGVD